MFFRREKPHVSSFAELMGNLKKFGIAATSEGASRARLSRGVISAVIEQRAGEQPHVDKAGLSAGKEIGALVNGGYQMFWQTPTGKRIPAQASQLTALHEFEEDLKEGLGLTSLYNQGLGTTSDLHLYDRVEHRDHGDPHKPWEVKTTL
jgi:hypothetical protein